MSLKIKIFSSFLIYFLFLASAFSMSIEKEKLTPSNVIVIIDKKILTLDSNNEKNLGLKHKEFYSPDVKQGYKVNIDGSYSDSSQAHGDSIFHYGEDYFLGVSFIIEKFRLQIVSSVQHAFKFIRVVSGWHSNSNDGNHFTIMFLDEKFKEIKENQKLHLDGNGIRPMKAQQNIPKKQATLSKRGENFKPTK